MNFYSSGDRVVRASQFSSPILIEQGLNPSGVSQCSNQIPRRLTIYLQVFPECELVGPWKRPVLPPSFSTCFIFWTNLLTWPQLRSLSVCHMDGLFYQWGWFCPKILKQLLQQSDIICSRAFAKNPKQTLGNLQIKTRRAAGELAQRLVWLLCKHEGLHKIVRTHRKDWAWSPVSETPVLGLGIQGSWDLVAS